MTLPPTPQTTAKPIAPPPGPLILVIEDDAAIRKFLRVTLTAHGYRVNEAVTAREGQLQAAMSPPELILLDLGLPDGDGLDVTRQVRTWSTVPIIVLSARGQETDKVAALDAGADDYLTKPFGVGELTARIRVALRHSTTIGGNPGGTSARGGTDAHAIYAATVGEAGSADRRTVRVDLAARLIHITDGPAAAPREVRMTPTEFKLLAFLIRHAGKVLTHQQILKEVWGPSHATDVHYLRVYAAELRKKLETDPAQPRFLITEPGVGYRLIPPSSLTTPS